jgi:FkbH-like protein
MQHLTEPVLLQRLRTENDPGKLTVAAEFLSDARGPLRPELLDQILAELARSFVDRSLELRAWSEKLGPNLNTAYLCARLAADSGDLESSAAHWERFLSLTSERDPFVLFSYVKVLSGLKRFDQAALVLQRALSPVPRYAFFTRADKTIREIGAGIQSHLRECRIAILGASTTTLLIPILRALCLRDRIKAEFYEGLYGSIDQEILDPDSGLSRFRPDIVCVLAHWRSLQLPALSQDQEARVIDIVEAQKGRWNTILERLGCHVIQQAFDFPAEEAFGYLAHSLPGGRSKMIQLVNLRLQEQAARHVSILDTPAVQREVGLRKWQDQMQWHSFQQHPSTEALPALADEMLAHARAVLGLTRKVLVTDLDNTLWKGIVGEDGLNGIKIGPGSPHGEAHARLQQYLLDLKARGILLAVASKNNYEDACQPFQKHPHMLLRMEDFAAFEANWNDKASSIREIGRKLSLGLDSFVFLDDNPLEREWVRSQIPELAVVELGPSVFHYVEDLDRGRHFFAISLSAEDRGRAEQYKSEAVRKHLQATSQSLDEFLAQLQLRASCAAVDQVNLTRVAQLTNKTNQFNLTTRRYTEAQVQNLASETGNWAAAFHLADRMGEYGLIGVIFCRPRQAGQWEIDTWLMSCRVLGRQMEKFMLDRLIEAAQGQGIRELIGVYRPTPKNGLVRDHFDKLGFEKIGEDLQESLYRREVPAVAVRQATHIRNENGVLSGAT